MHKIIDGKRYRLILVTDSKKQALKTAKEYRKKGKYARTKNIKKHYVNGVLYKGSFWEVWIR